MGSVFLFAFNAITPILLLILFGYFLKKHDTFPDDFFRKINTFAFRYCFPFLMFQNLYDMESIRALDYRLALFLIGCIILFTISGIVVANRATAIKNRKGVIIQASFRSNFALIGLPLSEGLAGQEGLMMTSAMQAPVVIYYNLFSVIFYAIYSNDAEFNVRKIVKNTVRNPLLQGLFAGLIALIIRELIPVTETSELVFSLKGSLPWLYKAITYMARVATPVALISLGGQFSFSHVSGMKKELVSSVLMRLIFAPAAGFALAFLVSRTGFISLTPAAVSTMIACFGSPLAVSSVPMAAEMGADADMAGQVVVWTSFLSMFSIFILAMLFRGFGLL